jgi:hypothetical protein
MKQALMALAIVACLGCSGHSDRNILPSGTRIEPLDCRSLDPVRRCIDPRCSSFCNDTEDVQCGYICKTDPRCANSDCAK